eukprot:Lithocolla_globosa_v1_NODE_1727_length_2377_cov_16.907407.p2 type:complete len:243 gc:universal NODE_1727_length_2377_cov_16.907407:1199-471(-)
MAAKVTQSAADAAAKVSKAGKSAVSSVTVAAAAVATVAAETAAAAQIAAEESEVTEEIDNIIEGYIGKPKGKKQILWERGLWVEGMKGPVKGKPLDPALNMDEVLRSCRDFREEKSALQALVEGRGHILIMSPKCSPELAGVGIEYVWGKSKQVFRRDINDGVPANLHTNIEKALSTAPDGPVPLWRVRNFARRTRDYRRVYSVPAEEYTDEMSYSLIERMRKERKTHRNIVDIEAKFLKNN